jgi:uncharacterized cupin superfamily protein
LLTAVGFAGCGGSDERQDENEVAGEFPVEVTTAKFPTRQRLAKTVDLELQIENVGDEAIQNLTITLFTGDEKSDAPFNIRTDQEDLADPNRPVWVLENGFPKVPSPASKDRELNGVPTAGAETASSNTYAFGPLQADQSITAIWRVTPVRGGTYTVNYEVAAGLDGKAKAVTQDGSPVEGEFIADISTKPPKTRVTDSGKVVPQK